MPTREVLGIKVGVCLSIFTMGSHFCYKMPSKHKQYALIRIICVTNTLEKEKPEPLRSYCKQRIVHLKIYIQLNEKYLAKETRETSSNMIPAFLQFSPCLFVCEQIPQLDDLALMTLQPAPIGRCMLTQRCTKRSLHYQLLIYIHNF